MKISRNPKKTSVIPYGCHSCWWLSSSLPSHTIIFTSLAHLLLQWRSQNFFLLKQGTTVRSCRARAECGNLLLGIVTLLTSGTERAIVGVLPSSLLAASCHHDFRHWCGFYVWPRPHDSKISYGAVASVALMVATPLSSISVANSTSSSISPLACWILVGMCNAIILLVLMGAVTVISVLAERK